MTIPVVVLTGGRQGGKTSALDAIRQEFADKVVVIPEAATTLLASYPMPGKDVERTDEWLIGFQEAVIQTQRALERSWREVAKARKARLIVADRGLLDCLAYMPAGEGLQLFLTLAGMGIEEMYSRYSGVIHLESVATCAPEKFGKIGNAARYETVDQAVELELALRDAWKAHPNWNFVSGASGIASVIDQVISILGKYVYVEHERKFLLQAFPTVAGLGREKKITQGYFETKEGELRLRNEAGVTTIAIKSEGGSSRDEWEKPIPGELYQLLRESCPYELVKSRYTATDEHGRRWEIDVYHEDLIGLITAECEFADADEADNLELPDWLEGAVDVTDDPSFKNKNLARYGLPDMARPTFL